MTNATIHIDGAPRQLKLTLGALAEIEAALGVADLAALAVRLSNPAAADLFVIVRALLRAGGADIAEEALKASDIDLKSAMTAIAETFRRDVAIDAAKDSTGEAPGKPQPSTTPGSG